MKGLQLRSLTGELKKVPAHRARKPSEMIDDADNKLGSWKKFWMETGRSDFNFLKYYYELPLKAFEGFSFDELCKLHYSTSIMMDKSVGDLFEMDARYEIVRKVESSMWRWSTSKGTWNDVVDAYEKIRNFTFLDDPDFEVRLDHTTYYNEFGHGKYSRIFIDGVFAFLLYYKREHVMTVAFSILEGRRLLIQQIQSAKRTGNRYLYKLPENRVEFVIDLFLRNFPGYKLYVLDGKCLIDKTVRDYELALESARNRCVRYRGDVDKYPGDAQAMSRLKDAEQNRSALEERIVHLKTDASRLTSFYQNVGRFHLGPSTVDRHHMLHHEIVF